MSALRCLKIYLGSAPVGILFTLDTGYSYFQFDNEYAMNPNRPILSIQYLGETEDETREALQDKYLAINMGTDFRLPVFFQNLLPEGVLRKHLIQEADISEQDEIGLLSFCGTDLPGNVVAVQETLNERELGKLLTQGRDSYELSSFQLPTPEAESLSGVQPKISLVNGKDGRYVMRSKNDNGLHFIGKLPASSFDGLPQVEFLSLQLARAAGVNTCEASLLPLSDIASTLPFSLRDDDRKFLLVNRFDRDVETDSHRLHMEDFAQVLGFPPGQKYSGDYASIGLTLLERSSKPEEDLLQYIRRLVVNELLGNYDAHLKNFSLLYTPDGQSCSLSPAYDIVAYAAYLTGKGNGLDFYPNAPRGRITPSVVRAFANVWEIPEKVIKNEINEVLSTAVETWPDLINYSEITDQQKDKLIKYFHSHPQIQRKCERLEVNETLKPRIQ